MKIIISKELKKFMIYATDLEAAPGDVVSLEYDFGGYIIESEKYHIPDVPIIRSVPTYTPSPTPTPDCSCSVESGERCDAVFVSGYDMCMMHVKSDDPVAGK